VKTQCHLDSLDTFGDEVKAGGGGVAKIAKGGAYFVLVGRNNLTVKNSSLCG